MLGQQWHSDFLQDRPSPIDRVIVVPGDIGLQHTPEDERQARLLETFFQSMQAEQFDLAIQIYGGGLYSNPYVLNLGAKTTAGMKNPDAAKLDRWVPYIYFQSEVLRYLEVMALVGASTCHLEPKIEITSRDIKESFDQVSDLDRPMVILHVGAGDPRRQWPLEKFARVADLMHQMGAQSVVIGTDMEVGLISRLKDCMKSPILDVCNQLSLGGLAGLFSRAGLVISNDSGPLHLAAACGAPTIGIYWCGNTINAGPVTTSRHRPLLSWQLNCPECGRDIIYDPCQHRVSFVDGVAVEKVVAEAGELLGFS